MRCDDARHMFRDVHAAIQRSNYLSLWECAIEVIVHIQISDFVEPKAIRALTSPELRAGRENSGVSTVAGLTRRQRKSEA